MSRLILIRYLINQIFVRPPFDIIMAVLLIMGPLFMLYTDLLIRCSIDDEETTSDMWIDTKDKIISLIVRGSV